MPQFDYKKARDAGITDQQIFGHLQEQKSKGINVTLDRNEVESYGKPQDTSFAKRTGKAVVGFLGKGAEFPARLGATIGTAAANSPLGAIPRLLTSQRLPETVKTEFQKPSVLSPGGTAPFQSLPEAGVSALRTGEVLTTPAFGVGKSFLGRTLITGGLGATAGLRQGLEEQKTGRELAGEVGMGAAVSQVARVITAPLLIFRNLGLASSQIDAAVKAAKGKKVDISKTASAVDKYIEEAKKSLAPEALAAARKLEAFRDKVAKAGQQAVGAALETKTALQKAASRYYDKEVIPALKAAEKAVAYEIRIATEKAAPGIITPFRRLQRAHKVADIVEEVAKRIPGFSVLGLKKTISEGTRAALQSRTLRKAATFVSPAIPATLRRLGTDFLTQPED